MADVGSVWDRAPCVQSIDPNEKLFLFGYSCKIFRDDEKSKYIDKGKHLIPWMGDEKLMIDRYDVRGYLHDLKQYEPNPDLQYEDPESEEEKLCDEERYRSLRSEVSEEQLYQEEELKRLRAAIASDGAYHEIGFSYDNEDQQYKEPEGAKVEEPEDELYEPPAGLKIPKGMELPYNMKIHTIIEKTALFVSEQGGQMEIIIKMKQHANPQFGFMHLDNPLYPYYKFLVKEIKSGSYKPVQRKRASRSESEDEDGHYLHPSLLSGKTENVPKFTVPSINFRRSQDDSYSVLVRNLKQQQAEEKIQKEPPKEVNSVPVPENQRLVNYCFDESLNDSHNNSYAAPIIIPPPDIQPIIQKMAEYVAKNGEDFEYVVKSKNDKRFEFLQPSCQYYHYYIQLRDEAKWRLAPPPVTENVVLAVSAEQPNMQENYEIKPTSETNVLQTDVSAVSSQPPVEEEAVAQPTVDEFDSLYCQDSQDSLSQTESQVTEVLLEDQNNSMDSVDSTGVPKDTKAKSSKVLKGPISFSLKVKDTDAVPSEKIKIPLLLDDSDEDSSEEGAKEKSEPKRRKSTEEIKSASSSRHDSVEREEKSKLNSEIEAKLAEDKKKDKLLSAARERIVQQKKEKRLQMEQQKREEQLKKEKQQQIETQRKEKQLQLERKKKAALFLKMLKKRNPHVNIDLEKIGNGKKSKSEKSGEFWNLPETADDISPENGILFPVPKLHISTNNVPLSIPGIKTEWSSSSGAEESGEEIMITEFCSEPDPTPAPVTVKQKVSEPVKHERKKKKKKHTRSKSQERRSKSSRSRDRHRSRSPRNYKHEKSKKAKELPAAYAFVNRSRSRSRSPRRYRQNPYWNRRR